MADDVKNLLDALKIERAALLGISMGGMIAQEFAIHYPEKLSCLILGCTSFGGPDAIPIPHDLLKPLPESAFFCDETIQTNRGLIARQMEARSKFPTPPFAFARQVAAILNHDAMARLDQIRVPTLVTTGKDDRLIPPANSRLVAARIPGAVLKELPGGHLFTSEYPDLFNRDVIEFVKAQPPAGFAGSPPSKGGE
jgi:pimeloyl-ACP methyl ester carboxylesterase